MNHIIGKPVDSLIYRILTIRQLIIDAENYLTSRVQLDLHCPLIDQPHYESILRTAIRKQLNNTKSVFSLTGSKEALRDLTALEDILSQLEK